MNSRAIRAWTRCAVAVTLLAVVLSPAAWLVLMSFRHDSDIMTTTLAFRPTLHNYTEAWTGEFADSFGHSVEASIGSTRWPGSP
jgi:ABC-type glycerol-3-phosphate transport system permease component